MATRPKLEEASTAQVGIDDPSIRPSAMVLCIVGQMHFARRALPPEGQLVIGRSEEADIFVDDPTVSRRHAVLHLGPTLRVEDLGSANGTRVGTRKLAAGELAAVGPGAVIDLGSITLFLQRGAAEGRVRRVWPHSHFEARLEEECGRAEATGARFALARLRLSGPVEPVAAQEMLSETCRPGDTLALYGPGEYELLLLETTPDDARERLAQAKEELVRRSAKVEVSLAFYPRDGRDPERLLAVACGGLEGKAREREQVVVVEDEAMKRLHQLVARVAPGKLSVLLLGETGVGKEVVAEAVHRHSPRARKPLLKLNCAALSSSLLESELFGHEKGAFTGAEVAKPGLLETADGGSVFLDEIGELPMQVQVKLLRVLEEERLMRVGAVKTRPIDVRFISATNRDLEVECARGNFRKDLYYRLGGVSILVPPLRERTREIEPLCQLFLSQACRQLGRAAEPSLSPEALAQLRSYSWPGNIRELKNAMERAVLLSAGAEIGLAQLPLEKMAATLSPRGGGVASSGEGSPPALREEIERIERQRILDALDRCAGNQTQAAKLLKISRGTLLSRLEAFGLPRPRGGKS